MIKLKAIFSILIVFQVSSQEIKCGKYGLPSQNNIDSSQLVQFCGFLDKEVKQINLVSLNPICWEDERRTNSKGKPVEYCNFESVINKNDSIEENRFKTIAKISKKDASQMLNILYQPERDLPYHSMTLCYEPRHGIAFYDSKKKLIGFIEVCFECSEIRNTSNLPKPRYLINEDYIELNNIFSKYLQDYITKENP